MRVAQSLIIAGCILLAAACGETAAPAKAADAAPTSSRWTVDYGASRLGFRALQTGTEFEGHFEDYDAEIIFDPEDLSTTSIDVTISMTSARTGDRQRDIALPGKDWFDAKKHPTASFISEDVEQTAPGEYVAHGALTIRAVTKQVELPFMLEIDGDSAHATGGLTLIRTDFGVGQVEFESDEWVGFEVEVSVDITATR